MKMKTFILSTLLAVTLLACMPVFGAQISIGIRIGPPPAPRAVAVVPVSPSTEHLWVAGYWYPVGNHYKWHEGYWTRAPYAGARWVTPRYEGGQFYNGYWDGDHGRKEHDHKWDRDHDRRDHDREHDRG
jgi:WXXGXW repeat (2 copies)